MTTLEQFETFMQSHQNMVYTTALRLLGNEADARDVVQEVFLRSWKHFGELFDNPRAGGWLRRVATNLCLNHLTRHRARWKNFTDLTSPDTEVDFADHLPAPAFDPAELDEERRQELLAEALKKLPDKQRVPLVLFHFDEMNYEQIAARLGVSLGKVKTDIHRAREALRRLVRLDAEGDLRRSGFDEARDS